MLFALLFLAGYFTNVILGIVYALRAFRNGDNGWGVALVVGALMFPFGLVIDYLYRRGPGQTF